MPNKNELQNEPQNELVKKIKDLEALTSYFESPELDLDQGIKKYEEGMKLVAELKGLLESYQLKIKEIKQKYADDL